MPDMPTAATAPLVDDAAAAAAAHSLRARILADEAATLDPELHALGVALAANRMERGAPGFYAAALAISSALRTEPNRLRRFLRPWYEGARDMLEDNDRMPTGVDGADAVRAALRAISGTPDAPAVKPAPLLPEPLPGLLDWPETPAPPRADAEAQDDEGWEAALMRAEQAAAHPAAPAPAAPESDHAPPAAVQDDEPTARRAARSRRKRGGYRFSDLLWGAFFVPGVLIGLVVFLFLLVIPPFSYITGLAAWDVRPLAFASLFGIVLWCTSLALLFPPVWYAWRRGRRSWIWPLLAAPVVIAILVFISTLIVVRSPMHPDFIAKSTEFLWLWGRVTAGAALSIAFGSRMRGLSRRAFRKVGIWSERLSGGEPRR